MYGMGYPIMFYVNDDLREALKSINNRSELINSLLREYFNKSDLRSMGEEELRRFIAKEKLKKEFEANMEELNGNN